MRALVEVSSLSKRFGTFQALSDVSMTVGAGEVICILGPSGSGKSTLLRCINRLEVPDEGLVRVEGQIVGYRASGDRLHELPDAQTARQRSRTGMVFQHYNLFPHKTVLENIVEGPVHVRKVDPAVARTHAKELLRQVGLAAKASCYPAQLSGGQQQRVAIARALAMEPALILFDEPTSALDPELVGEVLQVMRRLAESGMTMIVVTHEIGFARDVADRIVFMDAGKILESGPASQLLTQPCHSRTREFLAAVRS